MGLEKDYPVKILSRQLNLTNTTPPSAQPGLLSLVTPKMDGWQADRNHRVSRVSAARNSKLFYSSLSGNYTKLNPYFISGFVDAEGYFGTLIYKNNKLKTG